MAPIRINGNLVDLDSGHPKNVAFAEASDAADSDYILVQTFEPLNKAELAQLTELGAILQESVAQKTYLFHFESSDLTPIRSLGCVEKSGIYQKGLKVNSSLQECASIDPTIEKEIVAVLHHDKGETPEAAARRLATQIQVDAEDVVVQGNRVKMRVGVNKLKELSTFDCVRTIEEVPKHIFTNNIARTILNADIVINDTPYRGAGQTVIVADSGLDKGSLDDMHPAFKGRVKALLPVGRQDKTNDTNGHGTHVCGSIIGAKADGSKDASIEGIAPEAELVLQSLLNTDGGLFPMWDPNFNLKQMFVIPHREYDAYIHSNSWGLDWDGRQLPYDEQARQVDEAVWENPELLIVVAAGNDGQRSQFAQVGSTAVAKNCLTVGATESSRPSVNGIVQPTKLSPNDTTEISWYSSRGPTKEGRIKPDVLAPGTAILSAKSRDSTEEERFGKSDDPLWMYNSGTSMATPLVAGCAAVLREVLVKNGVSNPSAALLKALIINGSFAYHHAHAAKEGFGRVNLENSIIIPGQTPDAGFITGKPVKDRGEKHTYPVSIPKASDVLASAAENSGIVAKVKAALSVNPPVGMGITLKATLAYTDKPSNTIQNDLNLFVMSSDGIQRNGNMGSYTGAYDYHNNVQQILWKGIPPGEASINVIAGQILSDQQDYALVWRIIHTEE